MFLVLSKPHSVDIAGEVIIAVLADTGELISCDSVANQTELVGLIRSKDLSDFRLVWDDTNRWYPKLLAEGIWIPRCVDLRLSDQILRHSEFTRDHYFALRGEDPWLKFDESEPSEGLFELERSDLELDSAAEFAFQSKVIENSERSQQIKLLLAAESAGALVAAEMKFCGLPLRSDLHEQMLVQALGPRPRFGERPKTLAKLLSTIQTLLNVNDLNPDSPAELIKGLKANGLNVSSTRSWELKRLDHPVVAPLLEYKKLSRLMSANGWHWLDANVADGRFRPDYVVGGVVTGRWASRGGGGAMQLPKQVRGSVVADSGWQLVVADAAQLEPRILAALSGDSAMAKAGKSRDMYEGLVATGVVESRDRAKVAMLAAMYGATTGDSAKLMPLLARAFPKAISLVESAARTGERGGVVTTRLGRTSPAPDAERIFPEDGFSESTDSGARSPRTGSFARSWGRFTRNFVVQGTAAEFSLCWMALLRQKLHELAFDSRLENGPHLVFFMHDELVIHSPISVAPKVGELAVLAAIEAGKLLFPGTSVEFPLDVSIVDRYSDAS